MSPNASAQRKDDGGGREEQMAVGDQRPADVIDLCSQNSEVVSEIEHEAQVESGGATKRAALRCTDACLSPPPPKKQRTSSNFVDLTEDDDDDGGNTSNNDKAQLKQAAPASPTADLSTLAAMAYTEPTQRTSDGATVTPGIVALLHSLSLDTTNIRTCGLCSTATSTAAAAALASSSAQSRYLLPLHYRQPDKWSCGYRNFQMILSSLIPLLPSDHPYFESALSPNSTCSRTDPPTIRAIQGLLEQAWSEGFDPKGRGHYRGKIRGKKDWIGAVEVASVLWSMSVNCVVVQFIKRGESRRMLVDFLWNYFGGDGEGGARGSNVRERTRSILDVCKHGGGFATSPTGTASSTATGSNGSIASPLVPVYLQWKGHSVTIIGIERMAFSYNLLLLDPVKDGQSIRDILWSSRGTVGNATSNAVSDSSILLDCIRKPATELIRTDCQLVVCGSAPLSPTERMERMFEQGVDRFALTAGI